MKLKPLDPQRDGYGSGVPELVLVGPPGTGKTRAVLETWLQPAVLDCAPELVLGCSFTKAGATEMRERLAEATGLNGHGLKRCCKTIHSEALRVIRLAQLPHEVASGISAGRKGDTAFEALSRQQKDRKAEAQRVWTIVRHTSPEELKTASVEELLARMQQRSRHRIDALAAEIQLYEAQKKEAGQVDFTDMLLSALELEPPRRELLVVDEAQDLSPLQTKLVRHWASRCTQLVWVGDPDQGIFVFAGADGAYLTSLIRDGVPARSLQKSWRVPRGAHYLARNLIRRNKDRIDAEYTAADAEGEVYSVASAIEGAHYAATMPETETVLILARTGKGLTPYAEWLRERGFPFARERGGGSPLRKGKVIKVLLAMDTLRRGLRASVSGIRALFDVLPAKGWFQKTKKAVLDKLKTVSGDRDDYLVGGDDLQRWGFKLEQLLAADGLREACVDTSLKVQDKDPVLRIVERRGTRALVAAPNIVLTTIHSSKGREADHVVLDLHCPKPTRRAITLSRTEEDGERRVLYVGLTRTRNTLCLVESAIWQADLGRRLGLERGEVSNAA